MKLDEKLQEVNKDKVESSWNMIQIIVVWPKISLLMTKLGLHCVKVNLIFPPFAK